MIPHIDVILISVSIGQDAIWRCLSFPTSGLHARCTHGSTLPSSPLPLCSSATRDCAHNLLRLSRCPRPTSSISYRIQNLRTALVLTSCWAASYFSIQYSSNRSPQPTSRSSPSPHTAHHHHKLTASLFPGLHFSPRTASWSPDSHLKTRSVKGALKTEMVSSLTGVPPDKVKT